MSLAEINDIDLDSEIERKIVKNERRVYQKNTHGISVRVAEGPLISGTSS